jgi:hypothetical protein
MKKIKIILTDLRKLRLPTTRFEVKELVNTAEFEIGQGLTFEEVNDLLRNRRDVEIKIVEYKRR